MLSYCFSSISGNIFWTKFRELLVAPKSSLLVIVRGTGEFFCINSSPLSGRSRVLSLVLPKFLIGGGGLPLDWLSRRDPNPGQGLAPARTDPRTGLLSGTVTGMGSPNAQNQVSCVAQAVWLLHPHRRTFLWLLYVK